MAASVEAARERPPPWSAEAAAVGYDGVLLDYRMPWLKADACRPVRGWRPLVLNVYVLELLHRELSALHAEARSRLPASE
jgi:hypothetical protein